MISIIIPYFNKSIFFKNTLSSIAIALKKNEASPANYEIIIVNDGSSINEKNKLIAITNEYSTLNLIILEKLNGGVSSARNEGIIKSNYPFIYFLDADDSLHEDFFCIFSKNCTSVYSHHLFNLKINNKLVFHQLPISTTINEKLFITLFENKCLHLSNLIFFKKHISTFRDDIMIGEDLLFIYESTKHNKITPHDFHIATYNYDGKFHATNKNGISLILDKLEEESSKLPLTQILNERNYLTTCFSDIIVPYDNQYLSLKIKILGFFKSKKLYSIVQKIRFLMP